MQFDTLDDFISELVNTVQYEHLAKFAQGDVLQLACEPDTMQRLGFGTQDALLKWAAQQTGRELRTMWKRLQVSRTFAPDQRNDRVSWECHWIASTTDDPAYWLARAADLEMTSLQLKMAIKAAGGEPDKGDTVFVCKAADGQVVMVSDDGRRVILDIAGGIEVAQGAMVVVTIALVQVTTQTEAADPAPDWLAMVGVSEDEIVDIVRGDLPAHKEVAGEH
jgi:hypothetical protein